MQARRVPWQAIHKPGEAEVPRHPARERQIGLQATTEQQHQQEGVRSVGEPADHGGIGPAYTSSDAGVAPVGTSFGVERRSSTTAGERGQMRTVSPGLNETRLCVWTRYSLPSHATR